MNLPHLLLLLFCLAGCTQPFKDKKSQVPSPGGASPVKIDYTQSKSIVAAVRSKEKKRWHKLSVAQKSKIFTGAVTTCILPCWLGTPWNFYGTTEMPGKGSIACGYFVTTVLRDAGLPIARIKLAQCASEEMIAALVEPAYISRYSNQDMHTFMTAIQAQGYGLYVIGLDSHTGFLYHDGKNIHFIHASYIGERVVTDEPAASSVIVQGSRYRVTGKLSADEKLLNRWIQP